IVKAYTGRLDLSEIETEVRAQVDAFTAVTGFAPNHIDGHLHAHVLPGIRDIVLKAARAISPRPWLRNTCDSAGALLTRGIAVPKALFIAALGRPFVTAARDLALNDGFSGIYGFSQNPGPYGALFGRFARSRAQKLLVQCHPGLTADPGDVIGHARVAEYK